MRGVRAQVQGFTDAPGGRGGQASGSGLGSGRFFCAGSGGGEVQVRVRQGGD